MSAQPHLHVFTLYTLLHQTQTWLQDDIYQPWEDQLPYSEFSVRLPHSSIPDIVGLLSGISDAEYLQLRAGLAKHWRAFAWDKSVGGTAVSMSGL
jgi:hypothetical protein